ncbi:hypothetical protein GCM10011348_30360 [Marinobacterium nitratireducens]|uniref:Integrase n=1 Tax=Marinobacterium nitratireducens TaxID=518897 RepID=A0A917ZJA6_9GAMM|nr:site-specific integrase [Marinobacterium nitratireducens]GGO84339.1 hypothetical protein GCM10011348_30360 [Marinobacterium nitratireducens]
MNTTDQRAFPALFTHQSRELVISPFSIPPELDGSSGTWREDRLDNMLGVNTDREAIARWVHSKHGSAQTQRTYRKEAERFLLWCYAIRGMPMSSLNPDDFQQYRLFMENPPSDWVADNPYARQHPKWRPFVQGTSARSVQQALTILNALYAYLVKTGYLRRNPLAVFIGHQSSEAKRRSQAGSTGQSHKQFSRSEWSVVLQQVNTLYSPGMTEREALKYERLRWVVVLMMETGRRIAEITNHPMSAFYYKEDDLGVRQWWFVVTGKGGKRHEVPVNDKLLKALQRFRSRLGLTPYPGPREMTPLVPSLYGQNQTNPSLPTYTQGIQASQLYKTLKALFREAAASIRDADPEAASRLEHAYPHMIRHTAITRAGKQMDLRQQQKWAGHADPRTTLIYNHEDENALVDATQKMGRDGW